MPARLPQDAPIMVIGAGTMGSGIAHVAARAGHPTVLYDLDAAALERARASIAKDLAFLRDKGRLTEADHDATLARLRLSGELADAAPCALVIEAIVEDVAVKRRLFAQLEALVADDAILASNTSSISITEIAAGLAHPGRVAGMHFFNPAPRMALVEVVSGLETDAAVVDTLHSTARAWGKTPVITKSTPGFIVNRVARPYYAENLRTLTEHACDPATLDALLRECGGFAMGPCELLDLIGLDVNLMVTKSVFGALGFDGRYAPSLIQEELVRSGRLGRKTGRGFFAYGDGVQRPAPVTARSDAVVARVTAPHQVGGLEPLVARLAAAGVSVRRVPREESAHLQIGDARVERSDGRTATRRAADEGGHDLVLVDLAFDYSQTPRLAIARADQCSDIAFRQAIGTFQAAGIAVTPIDDIAGMAVLRVVCMLVNEAADVLAQHIATAADIDAAMQLGVSYPRGPLAWADQLGPAFVARVLDHLREHTGEARYRVSPALNRRRWSGAKFHE
jgi:3-hydroxybutyryl-CoA dehydrogenase